VHFARGQQSDVVVALRGEQLMGQLLDLSEAGARIALRDLQARVPAAGEVVDLRVAGPGGASQNVEELVVREAPVDPDGRPTVVVLARSERARGQLWFQLDRLCGSGAVIQSLPSLDDLVTIPGRGDYSEEARVERLRWLENARDVSLAPLHETRLSAERLSSNLENMIGAVEVPVGLAGPLRFRGQHVRGALYAPMATTEGALIASCTRGAKAISLSGAVVTRVLSQRMLRVPCFTFSDLQGALIFAAWVRDHVEPLRDQSRRVSNHAKLTSVEPTLIGNLVNVAFVYETGDAAGQNMTTACTWACCQWLSDQMKHLDGVQIEDFLIEGNMSGDKKVTFQSFIAGRGIRVTAEAFITTSVLADVLKVTPDQIVRGHVKGMIGALQTGMVGYTANVANTIAAIFTATGQDIACVHECSLGHLSMEVVPDGIHTSLLLPALVVGTVGGGTHLPAQRALLEMLGCTGDGSVARLAEIIAGFALALDLSTATAIISGQFASAHERLGRNRPVEFFAVKDLTPAFFTPGVRRARGDETLTVIAAEPTTANLGSSIVTEVTGRAISKMVGFFPYRLTSRRSTSDGPLSDEVLVKVKPLDDEVILTVNRLASMCGPRVASAHSKARYRTGFKACHVRELAVYEQTDPRFVRHAPRAFATYRDDRREAYVLVLERLTNVTHLDLADDPSGWTGDAIERALLGIADVHAIWLGREKDLLDMPWIGEPHTSRSMHDLRDLWGALANHAATEFPELVTSGRAELLQRMIRSVAHWWPELERMPRTLIHGDFSPRNACLRDGRLCAYDWEMATVQVPQHDMAEFLTFVLPADVDVSEAEAWVGFCHEAAERAAGCRFDTATYHRGFVLSLRDMAINRLLLYLMAHTFKQYRFLPHVTHTLFRLLEVLDTEDLPDVPVGMSGAWPVARWP
jgi:NADP-dependent 3-hydroxy-3-methylglutaryl-CoA reductase